MLGFYGEVKSMFVSKKISHSFGKLLLTSCAVAGLFAAQSAVAQEELPGLEASAFDFEDPQPQAPVNDAKEAIRRQAFDAALEGMLPLRPEEIRTLLERFDRTQESVELPVYPAPKPETVIKNISLDPGADPISLKMAYGHVSTVSFVDSTGAPWPIHTMTWAGNFRIVEMEQPGEGEEGEVYSHRLIISPTSEFAFGNISISLLGLDTPIIMTLTTSRDEVYYRFDGVIPERGPLAKTSLIKSSSSVGSGLDAVAGSAGMSAALEGVVPPGAMRLDVAGADGRTSAFSYNGMTYLRTPLTLLSPGWSASVASQDGMRVYELTGAPVVLLSDRGHMVRARLSNREDIIDE